MQHLSSALWHGHVHCRVLWDTVKHLTLFSKDAPRCRKPSAASRAPLSPCPQPAEGTGSLLALSAAALQLAPLRGTGANLGAPGGDSASRHRHLLLIIADAAGAAVGHRAAHSLAGGGYRGALRGTADVPTGATGAELAGKVNVEGAAGGNAAAGEALHLTVALQVGGTGAGFGARRTAAPSSCSGRLLQVLLRAWGAGAGVARGFWGSAAEQEAGERQTKHTTESHASGERKCRYVQVSCQEGVR